MTAISVVALFAMVKCGLFPSIPYRKSLALPVSEREPLLSAEATAFNDSFNQALHGTWASTVLGDGSDDGLFQLFDFKHSSGNIRTYGYLEDHNSFGLRLYIYDGDYINSFIEAVVIGDLSTDIKRTPAGFEGLLNAQLSVVKTTEFEELDDIGCTANILLDWNSNTESAQIQIQSRDCGLSIRSTLTFINYSDFYSAVINYGYVLSLLVFLCVVASIREFSYSNQNQGYAKNISIVTLLLSAVWNYTVFVIQFITTTQKFNTRMPLIFPTMSIFFYINIFQMQIFIYIWRSRNSDTLITPESNMPPLFKFNCKVYVAILFGILLVIKLLHIPYMLMLFLSVLWIPQIVQNMYNSHSKAPSIFYIVSVSVLHLYVPLYMTLVDGNFLEVRPNYVLGYSLLASICAQAVFMILQKALGTRKLLPWFLKARTYNLKQIVKGAYGASEADCPICLIQLCIVPGSNGEVAEKYMKTPCNHNFHEQCLEEWVIYKCQCPVCRSNLPSIKDTD